MIIQIYTKVSNYIFNLQGDLCINMNNHQNAIFHQLGDFMKHSHSFAMTIFHKITKSAKLVTLLIIPTYAKVSQGKKIKYILIILVFLGISFPALSEKKFENWQDLKFKNIVKQKYDFSCGVAALTTLFNYQFGKNTKEQKLLLDYLKSLPKKRQNKITEFGLSLFELKEIGEYFGFQVYVVKIPFQGLVKANRPALVYIENENFKHFVVFRGFKKGKVFLADPSLGNRSILPKDFINLWKGTTALFLVSKKEKNLNILDIHNKELTFPQYQTIRNMLK